jgi:hypothetical protein
MYVFFAFSRCKALNVQSVSFRTYIPKKAVETFSVFPFMLETSGNKVVVGKIL